MRQPICPRRLDTDDFATAKSAFSKADVKSIFDWDNFVVHPMPDLLSGEIIRFSVRIRPIVRKGVVDSMSGRKRDFEIDAFQSAMDRGDDVDRTSVYIDWLKNKFGHGLRMRDVTIMTFRILDILISAKGGRRRYVKGPDATMRGEVCIESPERFEDLLLTGIGRHEANGYGLITFEE